MKYNLDNSRMGMLIFLGVALGVLWLMVAYGFYKESERAKYDVTVSPGAVTYGTHSTALMPTNLSPLHKGSIPMLSGAAIRSYAHGGHADMSGALSAKDGVYTTSSAQVKSLGSGMGNSGIATTNGSSSRRANRGITYGGGSVAVPTLAMVSSPSVSAATASDGPIVRRKAKPGTEGVYGQWSDGGAGDGDWWYYNGDEWIAPWVGATRIEGGKTYVWNGTVWEEDTSGDYDPVPVGPLPWLFMLLLAIGYSVRIIRKSH